MISYYKKTFLFLQYTTVVNIGKKEQKEQENQRCFEKTSIKITYSEKNKRKFFKSILKLEKTQKYWMLAFIHI